MLRNTLEHIPQIVLLRSDKIAHRLIEKLMNNHWHEEDTFLELIAGVRDFYPNYYRLDDMELSLQQEDLLNSGITYDEVSTTVKGSEYNFEFINGLFEEFFVFDGSHIWVKESELEVYLALITKISPLQIIGYKLAKMFFDYEIKQQDLEIFVECYTPLGLKVDKNTAYADNHIHLNGAGYLAFNMYQLFAQPTLKIYYHEKFIEKLPRINEFSYLNNHSYSIGQLVDILKLSINHIYGSFMDNSNEHEEEFSDALQKIVKFNQPFFKDYPYSIASMIEMEKIFPIFKEQIEDELLQKVMKFYKKQHYSKAHLMEFILFFFLYQKSSNPFFKAVITLFLQLANILRSYMVMSQNHGLAHFSEFSGSTIRQVERKNAQNTAHSIASSGTTHINAKIGISKSVNQLSNLLQDFMKAFENENSMAYNFTLSTVKKREKEHIVIQGNLLLPRFFSKRLALKKEALLIDDFMRNVRYRTVDMFSLTLEQEGVEAYCQKEELQDKIYDVSRLVVALDAVGKETHTPPEIFAPFFRYLRNMPKQLKNNIYKGLNTFKLPQKLLITVHVGEDFNHILTGMRRVDEVISFFDMERHDRLGHVLSLGITPKDWLNNVREISIYQGDYFDDLVWLCWRLKKISLPSLDVSRFIRVYEDKIWELFDELYPLYHERVRFHHLYEAWKYRKNCVLTCEKDAHGVVLFDSYSQCVYDDTDVSKEVKELYSLYQTNKIVREAYAKVIKISKKAIVKEELMIWEALQDSMIESIAQKGIIIETNPSSNIFISHLDSYEKHPIFRFHPPKAKFLKNGNIFNRYNQRHGSIDVTVNSDDPAIFVTSLQNEFKILKEVAKTRYNCTDKEANEWIETIRRFGVKIFKESYNGRD